MKADDGIDVGAAARQLQHVASAETKPTAAFLLLSPIPRLFASVTIVAKAALTRLRPSTRSARTVIIHSCEVGGPSQVLPSPYIHPTKATYLSLAIFCARLMAFSVTPSQFVITSRSGRLPLTLSFHMSAPLPFTLPA